MSHKITQQEIDQKEKQTYPKRLREVNSKEDNWVLCDIEDWTMQQKIGETFAMFDEKGRATYYPNNIIGYGPYEYVNPEGDLPGFFFENGVKIKFSKVRRMDHFDITIVKRREPFNHLAKCWENRGDEKSYH